MAADARSKRILIVEDDHSSVDVLCNLLELVLGLQEVHVARDGCDGVVKAQECRPDVILMDLNLPKLDGWEATRWLKKDPRFADVPILAMTAHASAGGRARAIEAGCNDYFTKPIEVDEFVHFMRPYLSDR